MLTQDFSFPSEDYTGQLNDIIAKKTRDTIALHAEIEGKEVMPTEEIQIETDVNTGKKIKQKKRMEQYAPLIFEECYVKHKGMNKVANGFELD